MTRLFFSLALFFFVSDAFCQYADKPDLTGCTDSVRAFQTKDKYYLQVGNDKAIIVGKGLTRDDARKEYQKLLQTALIKRCLVTAKGSPAELIAYTEEFAEKVSDILLFRAVAAPKPSPAVLAVVDSVRLNPSKKLVLIKTLSGKYEIAVFVDRAGVKTLLQWDTIANVYVFNRNDFDDTAIQKALPRILYLKDSVAEISHPNLYLFYKPDNSYTLLSADSDGIATEMATPIKGAIGDSLVVAGETTKATLDDVKINVIPIKVASVSAKKPTGGQAPVTGSDATANPVTRDDKVSATTGKTVAPDKTADPATAKNDEDAKDSTSKKGQDTTFHAGITFLNAFNFDFSNKFSTSYLGLFNIYSPCGFRGKSKNPSWFNKNWGYNLGFEKINYSNGSINGNDSSQFEFGHQTILNDPLDLYRAINPANDTVRAGAKYTRQLNKYTFSSSNTVLSFYFQFLYNLHLIDDPNDKKVGIFAHAHFEFLVNKYTKTANVQNVAQDTGLVVTPAETKSLSNVTYYTPNQIVTNYNFISSYFGAGITGYVQPFYKFKNTHIFGQVTFGIAKNTPVFSNLLADTVLPTLNGTYNLETYYPQFKPFYLVRIGFIQAITANSDLMIGYNLRSDFGTQSRYAQYAAYVGVNIGLTPLINAIAGNSGGSAGGGDTSK